MKSIALILYSDFGGIHYLQPEKRIEGYTKYLQPIPDIGQFFLDHGYIFKQHFEYEDYKACDYIIFFELGNKTRHKQLFECIFFGLQEKMIYIAREPSPHNPLNDPSQLKTFAKNFKYVFTWHKELIDNQQFFYIPPAYEKGFFYQYPTFLANPRTKLITGIFSYLKSDNKELLYNLRHEVVRFFEENPSNDFEFYGNRGWENNHFRNYRGKCEDKNETLQHYKFSICFENCIQENYISEKIWSCLVNRTIPIYLGAPNVYDYIPKECYIDYTHFSGIEHMYHYIKTMDENTYQQYIRNINLFLCNPNVLHPYSFAGFFDAIYKVISME